VLNDGFISSLADSWNVGILIFLVLLGIIVALINKAGGSRAFGEWTKKHVKTKVGAQLATFVLGVLIFVDDYFNCLTVGSVMKPVADNHKISRAKLAYLIDATAAPICMIAPISSWAAAVSGVEIPNPTAHGTSLTDLIS
jgi:Na+/H+ antiporter NhaC